MFNFFFIFKLLFKGYWFNNIKKEIYWLCKLETWRKNHRYLTVPNTVDMELLEILFDKHTYHARGIDFEVNLFLYF